MPQCRLPFSIFVFRKMHSNPIKPNFLGGGGLARKSVAINQTTHHAALPVAVLEEKGPIFQQPFCSLKGAQSLAGIARRAAGKPEKNLVCPSFPWLFLFFIARNVLAFFECFKTFSSKRGLFFRGKGASRASQVPHGPTPPPPPPSFRRPPTGIFSNPFLWGGAGGGVGPCGIGKRARPLYRERRPLFDENAFFPFFSKDVGDKTSLFFFLWVSLRFTKKKQGKEG